MSRRRKKKKKKKKSFGGKVLSAVAKVVSSQKVPPHPDHRAVPVKVGEYTIYAGGTRYLEAEDLHKHDIDTIIPLDESFPGFYGEEYIVFYCPLQDMGGVPDCWDWIIKDKVIPLLEEGRKLLVFCIGGHGRTGTFLASLISVLEPETKDPIKSLRERYCNRAVETMEQAEAVFSFRNEKVPSWFTPKYGYKSYKGGKSTTTPFDCPRCKRKQTTCGESMMRPGICMDCSIEQTQKEKGKGNKGTASTTPSYSSSIDDDTYRCLECNNWIDIPGEIFRCSGCMPKEKYSCEICDAPQKSLDISGVCSKCKKTFGMSN